MKTQKRKKSLVGWIWQCEFSSILVEKDGDILLCDDYLPQTTLSRLDGGNCNCGRNHKRQKVRITIEEII